VFEHAADSRVLIDQLINIQDKIIKESTDKTYYVKIIDELQSKESKTAEDQSNIDEIKLAEKFQEEIMKALGI
jgi:hypothetical protein